jgi:hypothetical protein
MIAMTPAATTRNPMIAQFDEAPCMGAQLAKQRRGLICTAPSPWSNQSPPSKTATTPRNKVKLFMAMWG